MRTADLDPRARATVDQPAEGARLSDDGFVLEGRVEGAVEAVLLLREGVPAVRVPVEEGRFRAQIPLGRAKNGAHRLALWALFGDGTRAHLLTRTVEVRRLTLGGVGLGELVGGAARKALVALREGRLPASPRHWLRNLRMHYGELQAQPPGAGDDAAPLGRALDEAEAARALDAFLASGERLRVAASPAPAISVVIPVYNRAELLLRALRSLPARDDLELVIVDDGSTDRVPALLARIDGARVIAQENRGFVDAANAGARAARGEVLCLLNSDVVLEAGALEAGLRTLGSAPDIGAVGGRLVLSDGALQEAGSIVFSDGSCLGYGRGADPDAPDYDFRRDVDFCSAACLLTPRALFCELGGFDEAYRPAYYEDADYCARLWERGLRVVYEPALRARHVEFASSDRRRAEALQRERRAIFVEKRRAFVAARPPREVGALRARDRGHGLRLLFLDDRAPLARHGSGHPRAQKLVAALAGAGHRVTTYATTFPGEDRTLARRELPPTIEIVTAPGAHGLAAFLDERAGYYDRILVSRPHNLRLLRAALDGKPALPVVYDVEALAGPREALRRALRGEPAAPDETRAELALAATADVVLAVSDEEAALLRAGGCRRVHRVGHALAPAATARLFAAREGLLFVGALYEDESPNADALAWLIEAILPTVRARLGPIWLTACGARPTRRLLALAGEGVELLGAVEDLTPLYDRARLFVAPTRFASGLPHKVHEAAAHGLPVVCTSLLARQLGWHDGQALTVADDAPGLAAAIAGLYRDEPRWQAQRAAALEAVTRDCDPAAFAARLAEALR